MVQEISGKFLSHSLTDSLLTHSLAHSLTQGIYLLLDLHSQAEKIVFLQLSDVAATQAEDLNLGT